VRDASRQRRYSTATPASFISFAHLGLIVADEAREFFGRVGRGVASQIDHPLAHVAASTREWTHYCVCLRTSATGPKLTVPISWPTDRFTLYSVEKLEIEITANFRQM
jgi:hypothetical protein